jgi:hypothetical protein
MHDAKDFLRKLLAEEIPKLAGELRASKLKSKFAPPPPAEEPAAPEGAPEALADAAPGGDDAPAPEALEELLAALGLDGEEPAPSAPEA